MLTLQSWGTKGSDKASEDLGVVKSDDKNEVTVMVPTEQKDLNALYENEMSIINSKPPKEEIKISPEQKQEDYYKVSSRIVPCTSDRTDVYRTSERMSCWLGQCRMLHWLLSSCE